MRSQATHSSRFIALHRLRPVAHLALRFPHPLGVCASRPWSCGAFTALMPILALAVASSRQK
eukprot:10082983-Alexandrium_andersonii.AAC.1